MYRQLDELDDWERYWSIWGFHYNQDEDSGLSKKQLRRSKAKREARRRRLDARLAIEAELIVRGFRNILLEGEEQKSDVA